MDIAAANQDDLSVALDRMICKTGIDCELFKTNKDNLSKVKPTLNDWNIYQQYAYAIAPLKQYSEFSQSKHVIFHNELFEGKMAIERLRANYYPMFENVFAIENGGRGVDLTKRERKDIVIKEGCTVPHSTLRRFTKQHQMIKSIVLCRRLAV